MVQPFDSDDFANGTDGVPRRPLAQWRSTMVVALLLATVLGVVVYVREQNSAASVESTTTTMTTVPGTDPLSIPLTRTINKRDTGEDVRRLQQRLKDLGFDPGEIDGVYGDYTMMAFWAFQTIGMKMTRDTITDFVTPAAWDVMRGPVVISPRRTKTTTPWLTDTHVEIYLPEQVMIVFKEGKPILITHISSGSNLDWCEAVTIDPGEEGNSTNQQIQIGVCGKSVTPPGVFYFYSRKVGIRESQLGSMWNPVYFNYGIAVHGALQIPNYPASHGCIRIPIYISEYFPSLVKYGDRVFVFDGVKEPEAYGSPPPFFNKPWPDFTTTTSSVPPGATTSTNPKSTTTTIKKK